MINGSTLMTAAAPANDVPFMQALLDAGASITAKPPEDDQSPMTCAIAAGAKEAVVWLLDQGVPIDRLDETPPIWQAIANGQEELALLLVERGAALNRSGSPMINVLAFAVSATMVALARRIATLAPFLVTEQMAVNSDLLISCCAHADFLPLLRHVVTHFSHDLTACFTGTPITALAMACDHGLLEHVEFLLAYGAPVGQRTKRGTALHEVARSGHLEILERLLAHGAVVDKRCSSFTPLMLAVSNGQRVGSSRPAPTLRR
jgi:ankyrin repeat protein